MIILDADKEGQVPVGDCVVSERLVMENPELITGQTTADSVLESHSVGAESPAGPMLRRATSTDANMDLIAVVENCIPRGSGKNPAETLFKSVELSLGLRHPQTDARIRPSCPDQSGSGGAEECAHGKEGKVPA